MQHELFSLYDVFTKTAFDASQQLVDINARNYEKLAKRQIELASDFVESSIKQFASHHMAAQKELAEEYADKAQKANKDTVKIITQAQDELNGYLGKQLPAAMEQAKSAIKDATQEAAETTRSAGSKKTA